MSSNHAARKHSKFSASGAERWFNCPGSVGLSEGLPDKESVWSKEGTLAHEVLEWLLQMKRGIPVKAVTSHPKEMLQYGRSAADFIWNIFQKSEGSEILVETRIHLDFIHPEMFGTFDGAVVDYFGTLHVFDYKYGAGFAVSPRENLQMIFYGLGLAHQHHWNFKRVRLWIIQPRIKGYDGPLFWDLSISDLRDQASIFKEAVGRVEESPETFVEGKWCHWCKAKGICPIKREAKLEEAQAVFSKL